MTATTAAPLPIDVIKARQRAGWSAAARRWNEHTDAIERQWGMLTDGLLDLARVAAGDRVLDLASGTGDPALAAALRVGSAGTVIATDISPDMLAFAAQRAAAAGLSNVESHEMDAERIDLPDASVDAVLCRLGLMFLPDLGSALTGVYRVLVPGGRFAAAIPWRPGGTALPFVTSSLLAALDLPEPAPPRPGQPGIFALADAAITCAALERAGMTEIRVVPHTVTHAYPSPQEWVDFVLAHNVPLLTHLAGVPAERIDIARRATVAAMTPHLDSDGGFSFPGHYYYATASRPSS